MFEMLSVFFAVITRRVFYFDAVRSVRIMLLKDMCRNG